MAWAQNGGNRIWWEEQGSGEPVLLAMGHGWDLRMWWPLMPALSARYRVIRFDNRGIGRTEWDGRPFLMSDLADDAFAVLDAAGVDRAHVYGVSMGGLTVQEMALRRQDRVASLVLGCTGAFAAVRHTRGEGLKSRIPFRLIMRLLPSALYGPKADPAVIAEDLRLVGDARIPSDGRLAQSKAIAVSCTHARLPEISAPTLVLHGDRDKAIKVEMGRELAARIPGALMVELEGSGHAYFGDTGGLATAALLDFLDAQPPVGG